MANCKGRQSVRGLFYDTKNFFWHKQIHKSGQIVGFRAENRIRYPPFRKQQFYKLIRYIFHIYNHLYTPTYAHNKIMIYLIGLHKFEPSYMLQR
jgi:hypothetical protein